MLAAFDAACCAANGVPLRDPRNPSDPELFHDRTLPFMSEMVTIVLLKDAWINATPCGPCLRSFFLKVFFLPFFSGAAPVSLAAAGLAIEPQVFTVSRFQSFKVLTFETLKLCPFETCLLCFRRRLLLLRDRSFARSFAGTRIGMRALSANRQVSAMAESAVGADFDEPLDVHRNFLAQIAFHQSLGLNDRTDAVDLFFAEVGNLLHRIDLRLIENASRARVADPIDIGQRNVDVLLAGKIHACNTCHCS